MNLISVTDLTKYQINQLFKLSTDLKRHPNKFKSKLKQKVLLTFFEMPSLRTEVSFDVAMFKMGGLIVDYHAETSPWGHGKESIEDVAGVLSRYVDAVMIRMHDHNSLVNFTKKSSIPVINGLTTYEHPCQILSDLFTIKEKFGKLKGLKLAYFGDSNNNVTHSLLLGCALMGIEISIACPKAKAYSPDPAVVRKAKRLGGKIMITQSQNAAKDANVIYTDSWMSYRIPAKEKAKRKKDLKNFQVSSKTMQLAKPNALFMHCMPATRGMEVTKQVIDGKQSVIFDQAENRLHVEKAILLKLLGV